MKKFRDRRDGIRLDNDGFSSFLYFISPKRGQSEVYISKKIDVTNLVEYVKNKKKDNEKLTYFHVFMTALAKLVYDKPLLNRFIIRGNKYQRNEVTLSYVAKTDFTEDAKEFMAVLRVLENDNIDTVSKKLADEVSKIRSNTGSGTDSFVSSLGKLPKFLMRFIVWVIKVLDRHDLIPNSLTKDSLYHSTILVSNLGSIHCGAIYHHLTDLGTNSIVVTIGEIKKETVYVDGKKEEKSFCEFGITLDERIADGVYFAKCVNSLEYILNNPSLLEEDANAKINYN